MATAFHRAFRKLMPSWLTTGEGELVHFSLGFVLSGFAKRWVRGLQARFPAYAPEDALAAIARDRKLVRGINESAEDFAVRLAAWLDPEVHPARGNPYALLEQIRAYCQQAIMVRTVDARGNWYTIDEAGSRSAVLDSGTWDWDGAGATPRFTRFWVIIYPTAGGAPWDEAPGTIGEPGPWGDALGAGRGYTIGTTATSEHVSRIRQIIRDWQPDGTRCEWIIIALDDASFDPSTPEPDGTWGGFGKLNGSNDKVVARLNTARYWRGNPGAEYP